MINKKKTPSKNPNNLHPQPMNVAIISMSNNNNDAKVTNEENAKTYKKNL